MKNTILKVTICCAAIVIGTSAFAGDHHGGHDRNHGNSGVRLATDIVNLVGASLNVLRPTAVVYTEPVYHCPPPPPPRHHHHHHRPAPPKPRHDGHGPGPRR